MGSSVQPLPPVAEALAQIRANASPQAQQMLAGIHAPPTLPPVHEALAALRTQQSIPGFAAESTGVRPGGGRATPVSNPIEMLEGLPIPTFRGATLGAAPAIAGAIAALLSPSSYTGKSGQLQRNFQATKQEWEDAQNEFAQEHPTANVVGQLAGGILPGMAVAPLGLVKGGAALGAVSGAFAPAKSVGQRILNTGIGTGVGALGGEVFKGVGHLATRTGLADLIGEGASAIDPAAGANLGTRGQVGQALADRQALLGAVGDNGTTPGAKTLANLDAFTQQTNHNYALARQNTQVLQDPALNQLLNDPDIAEVMQKVSAIRASEGNPLPQSATPDQVPLALQKMGVSPERYAELQALGQSRANPTPSLSLGGPSRVFHGTGTPFDEFDPAKADPNALYGPGHYFTEDPNVASSYATTKGAQVAPNVRMASLDIKNPFDANALFGDVGSYEHASDSPDIAKILSAAEQVRPDQDWDDARSLLDSRANEANISGQDIYKVLSRTVDENGIEAKRAAANQILQEAGYDGITHIGGKGGPHRVWVAFSPDQIQPPRAQVGRVPLSGVDILPPELMGEQTPGIEVPDPEAVHSLKRYLNDSVQRGLDSKLELTRDQARALLPKAQAITDQLHTLSPEWAQADAFHAAGKGMQEAYQQGFDAAGTAGNLTGETLTTNSPEAMLRQISQPRYRNEPPEQIVARADAFRQGMQDAAVQSIKKLPVQRGMGNALSLPQFAPTEPGAQLRDLMFGSTPDGAAQRGSLESLIAESRGNAATAGRPIRDYPLMPYKFSLYRKLGALLQEPDLLQTTNGQTQLMDLLRSPEARANLLTDRAGSAAKAIPTFLQGLGIGTSGNAAGAIFGPGSGGAQ